MCPRGNASKKFEISNFKKILVKIENVEKMHQKIRSFFYISKKNEILYTFHVSNNQIMQVLFKKSVDLLDFLKDRKLLTSVVDEKSVQLQTPNILQRKFNYICTYIHVMQMTK